MYLYYSSIEYNYREKNAKYKGGFVFAFVLAKDVIDAISKFTSAIENVGEMEINELEFVVVYEDITWDTKENQNKYDKLSKEAEISGIVVFDQFYAYENE